MRLCCSLKSSPLGCCASLPAKPGIQAKEAVLFQQIGKLQMELEWLKKRLSCSDARELRKLVDPDHPELSISRQCALLDLPRSTHDYRFSANS